MTKQTKQFSNLFKQTAQKALKAKYGFAPPLKDIDIYDGNSRVDFKINVNGKKYEFKSTAYNSFSSPDGLNVWVDENCIKELDN
jgi:hypothetical protein